MTQTYPWMSVEQYVLEGLAFDANRSQSDSDEEITAAVNDALNANNEDNGTTDDDLPYSRDAIIAEAIRLAREN